MSGAFFLLSGERKLRGWASLEEQPHYPVTVHLVADKVVLKSTIAEEKCPDATATHATEMPRESCWFEFDLAEIEIESDASDALSIVVGESGEFLRGAAGQDDEASPSERRGPASTYLDALAAGMSELDVVRMFYLDILRRPADVGGLAAIIAARARGERSFERWRRNLLMSSEYARRRKQVRDAAGNAFRRDVLWRSSDAVLSFEPLFSLFGADDLPLPARLIRFFPGLLAQDGAMASAIGDVSRGLPEGEIFHRALSRLAKRPALIVDAHVFDAWHVGDPDDEAAAGTESPSDVTVGCGSPLFLAGWHRLEGTHAEPHRWMRQIGVVRNPDPRRPLVGVDVEITGAYADTGNLLAASDSEELTVKMEDGGRHRLARIAAKNASFVARRLVLISSKATSPIRHDGRHDTRCVSIQVSQVRFTYAAGSDR